MAAAVTLEAACVGCSRSQNRYSCRLPHSVALGVHPDLPLNRPDPQHAFVVSLNPARPHHFFPFVRLRPDHRDPLKNLNGIDEGPCLVSF